MDHWERFYRLGHRWRGMGEIARPVMCCGEADAPEH